MTYEKNQYIFFAIIFICLSGFLFFTPALIRAGEEDGIQASTDLVFQISTVPEVKLTLNQRFVFPFLQGSSPLTSGNNITTVISPSVTPVSLNIAGEVIWEPVAFFLLSGGALAGSGWNMALGNGIGINTPSSGDPLRTAEIIGKPFDGLQWRAWGAGTVQFDLAAVIPGDWNHILFQTRQEFRYSAYTRAKSSQSWVFEGDAGENQNGWVYYASYVLGYSMPQSPVLNTIAFMAEMEKKLYYLDETSWGGNLGYWVFSGLFNFSITPQFSTALAIQIHTYRNYGTTDFKNNDTYYKDRVIQNNEGKRRILFYRAALIMTYKLN